MKFSILWLLVSMAAVSTCCVFASPIANIAGTYVGTYADGIAHFELRADGSYTTDFVAHRLSPEAKKFADGFHITDGRVFSGKGNWTIDGNRISFWCLPSPFDMQRQGFPSIHSETKASIDEVHSRILFEEEKDYVIEKVNQ